MTATKVLIVEDESVIALHTKRLLESRGFEVLKIASNANEAIKQTESNIPDVILLDIDLNEEVDGISVIGEIRKRFDIPFIYVTAHSNENILKRAKDTEPYGYIIKPVKKNELFSTIEITLHKHKLEKKLKESELYLKEAQSIAHLGHWKLDPVTLEMTGSDEFYNIFGFKKRAATLESFAEVVHPEDREFNLFHIRKGIKQGEPWDIEERLICGDGVIKNIRARGKAVKNEKGKTVLLVGTVQDITDKKLAEEALSKSEEKYRSLVENAPDIIVNIDMDGKIQFINRPPTSLTESDLLGKKAIDLIPKKDRDRVEEIFNRVTKTGELESFEVYSEKTDRWFNNNINRIEQDGECIGLTVILTEITEKKQKEELIKNSLREKEILLKEIHHRVKNNLQVVSSLLSLQSNYIRDEKDREFFVNSENRVNAMAIIHEKLYESEDLSKIDFNQYIRELTESLIYSYNYESGNVKYKVFAKDIYLDVNKAIPCALIINELVSNSLKYAFPNGRKGQIKINFKISKDNYSLIIGDNGVGLPDDFDYINAETLGLKLINALTKQLSGEINKTKAKGTEFTLTFPVNIV